MWGYLNTKELNDFLFSLSLYECKDQKTYIKTLYTVSNHAEKHYMVYKIPKRNGKLRTIHEPDNLLKEIQRNILKNILERKNISKYAKAYHKGISLKDNAIPHVGKKMILKLDIEDFFDSISFSDVYDCCFSITEFPKGIGMLLTFLCTYYDSLTQGSPTSAYISNLVMKDFDNEIGAWCEDRNISYTRYSDDMTFSGDFIPKEVIQKVRKLLYKRSLLLNEDKIHVVANSASQNVVGIVVNQKPQVSSNYRRKIRQEVYYIKTYGIDSHLNKIGIKDKNKYLMTLLGRIEYVLSIDRANSEFVEYKKIIREI